MDKQLLNQKGKERYHILQIILENILTITHIIFGMVAMWDVKLQKISCLSISYGLFLMVMLLFFLRKHLCTHCYYYGKNCHCGWGKLALLHAKESGNIKIAEKAAGLTWGVLMIFPLLISLILIIFDLNSWRIIIFGLLFLFLIIQVVLHKWNCKHCKMKNICPGAAK